MKLNKRKNDWNRLILVLNGHIAESGEVIPSNIKTVIHLGIRDVGGVFDQIGAFDDYEMPQYRIDICGKPYFFCLEMAKSLLDIVHQVWFDYEYC